MDANTLFNILEKMNLINSAYSFANKFTGNSFFLKSKNIFNFLIILRTAFFLFSYIYVCLVV